MNCNTPVVSNNVNPWIALPILTIFYLNTQLGKFPINQMHVYIKRSVICVWFIKMHLVMLCYHADIVWLQ